MKSLLVLLLAVLVGYLGYQYAYPKLDEWANFKKLTEKAAPVQPEKPKVASNFEIPSVKPVIEEPKMEPKKEEPKPAPEPKPVVMEEPKKKEPAPDEFTPPNFPPIEQVVKGWTEIPKKAFPREVTLRRDVEFVVTKNGNKFGTKVASGGKVHAVDQNGDKVTVAPAPTSPARVEVALADTDLKEILTEGYERWKPAMVEYLRRQWEFKRMAKSSGSGGASNPRLAARNDKPERAPDGSYPLLLASMKAGQVTEITPANIKKWGDLNVEKIDGQEYFTVIVDYTTKTMFGDFTTSAQARIREGKVVKWIYTGSGEVVP